MASIDLCVYGTPHGFSSYEVPAAMGEYCERFYRTNRKGMMLMENRRNDGSTIYSFLVYDLVETDKRQNAFFGTSFTLRGNQYIKDLRSLFMLFNTQFDTLIASGRLFEQSNGKYKYIVDEFGNESELLNNYFARLLDGLYNFDTEQYTSAFVKNNSGQIVLKNLDTPVEELTSALKHSQWLAVSPSFKKDEPGIEIDLGDITQQYTSSLEELSKMAIYSKGDAPDQDKLQVIITSTRDAAKLIKKYAAQGNVNNQELQKINEISSKLNTLLTNANALNALWKKTTELPDKNKSDITDTVTKNEDKPDINNSAKDKKTSGKGNKASGKKTGYNLPQIGGVIAVIIFIAVFLWILLPSGSNEEEPNNPRLRGSELTNVSEQSNAAPDPVQQYNEVLAQKDWDRALALTNEDDIEALNRLQAKFEETIKIIVTSGNGNAESNLLQYLSMYPNATRKFAGDVASLKYTAQQLDEISKALNKNSLSVREKNALIAKISRLGDIGDLKQELLARANKLAAASASIPPSSSESTTPQPDITPVKITLLVMSGGYQTTLDSQPLSPEVHLIELKRNKEYRIDANCNIAIEEDGFSIFARSSPNSVKIHKGSAAQGTLKIGDQTYRVTVK